MGTAKISVVVPAYNQAAYLGEAIQSVLNQTWPDFELVIVNDASPDDTSEIVSRFNDPRIKYIVHGSNRGLAATRNTGIHATTGDVIALLDGDDLFHPEKLAVHLEFLKDHPEVAVSYNGRYELNHSACTIRELIRPPLRVSLSDLVLGFPFAPSDIVFRRNILSKAGFFDEKFVFVGEDLDMICRIALAGFEFASVDRALSYRRRFSGKIVKNIKGGLDSMVSILNRVFADPHCPADVVTLRDKAFLEKYLAWACIAFAQDETTLGQALVRESVQLDPTLVQGKPSRLVETLLDYSLEDDSVNHQSFLKRMMEQLPAELLWLSNQYEWAVARGYLLKGTRATIWDRPDDANAYFSLAKEHRAAIDESYVQKLAFQLLSYEKEFGTDNSLSVIRKLQPYISQLGGYQSTRRLKGYYAFDGAFESFRVGQYRRVPSKIIRAFSSNPAFLANRGAWAVLFRSVRSMLDSRVSEKPPTFSLKS
jgi:glycosyltransferase involved in cell wall biosynthesis